MEEEHDDESVETVTRESLEAFYNAHDPTKLSNIDQVLDTFGDGSELIKALQEKYGASPETERREGAADAQGDRNAGTARSRFLKIAVTLAERKRFMYRV